MTADTPTPGQLDDGLGAVVALMRAMQSGDEAGFDLLLGASEDPRELVATAVGLALHFGSAAYGAEEFGAALVRWAPGRRLGDLE